MCYHRAGVCVCVCVSVCPYECIALSPLVVLNQLTDLHETSYERHFIGDHLTLCILHACTQ